MQCRWPSLHAPAPHDVYARGNDNATDETEQANRKGGMVSGRQKIIHLHNGNSNYSTQQ